VVKLVAAHADASHTHAAASHTYHPCRCQCQSVVSQLMTGSWPPSPQISRVAVPGVRCMQRDGAAGRCPSSGDEQRGQGSPGAAQFQRYPMNIFVVCLRAAAAPLHLCCLLACSGGTTSSLLSAFVQRRHHFIFVVCLCAAVAPLFLCCLLACSGGTTSSLLSACVRRRYHFIFMVCLRAAGATLLPTFLL